MPYQKRETGNQKNFASYRLIVAVIVGGLIILGVLQLIFSNQLATQGEEIAKIESQLAVVNRENEILDNQISSLSSLSVISSQASRLGLAAANSVTFLRPQAVALNK